jgi:hypothetical protein
MSGLDMAEEGSCGVAERRNRGTSRACQTVHVKLEEILPFDGPSPRSRNLESTSFGTISARNRGRQLFLEQ